MKSDDKKSVHRPNSDGKPALGPRLSDAFTAAVGSWRFIAAQCAVLVLWILLNVHSGSTHWDPYPFIFLNLVLSFQSAFAAPIIMMSQNRQADKDRSAAEVDHNVNTMTESEASQILRRMDSLEALLAKLVLAQKG